MFANHHHPHHQLLLLDAYGDAATEAVSDNGVGEECLGAMRQAVSVE